MLQAGDKAPDFTATTTTGDQISLGDYLGKSSVVLYFYPKDDTPGCTHQACEFRDSKAEYEAASVVVLGVSTDDQGSHQAFTEKYSLNFPLLVDSDGKLCDLFGVPRRGVYAARITFLIDPQGIIRKVWEDVNVVGHAADVISEVEALGHS